MKGSYEGRGHVDKVALRELLVRKCNGNSSHTGQCLRTAAGALSTKSSTSSRVQRVEEVLEINAGEGGGR